MVTTKPKKQLIPIEPQPQLSPATVTSPNPTTAWNNPATLLAPCGAMGVGSAAAALELELALEWCSELLEEDVDVVGFAL